MLGDASSGGSTATKSGGVQIVNNTNGPINATVIGAVSINEDEPVSMPSNLTFVVTPGSIFQPNTSMAMGFGASQAKLLIQSGGTLDPGNYVLLGATANQTLNPNGTPIGFQNLPYALPSPANGLITVEAGGRFLINDASGIGSAPAGSYTLKTDSVLQLGNTNAFYGRGLYGLTQTGTPDTTGVAVPGQFVYEPGAVVRLAADNIYKLTQFTPTTAAYEVHDNNRTITSQNNPFIIPVTGTPTIAPEDLTLGAGGMLTNDISDRNVNEGRGRLMLNNGAVLAATSGTFMGVQEGFNIAAGANITIGTTRFVDGMSKLGAVRLFGPNSNVAGAGASVTVTDGAQLDFNAANVFPDTTSISLPGAVQAFPGAGGYAAQPATGSTLLLNIANTMEHVGEVTGNGTVMANAALTALAMGNGSAADWTSNIIFKSTNSQNPSLVKTGATKLTLTGVSDSQGDLVAQQGEVTITGTGRGDWGSVRIQKGGKVTVDNSGAIGNAVNARLGNPAFLVPAGGTYELIGNDNAPVSGSFNALANSVGNFINVVQNPMISNIKVTPGTQTTTLNVGLIENFQSAGIQFHRSATWVIGSPAVSNLPGTYSSATGTAYTPNPANVLNGQVMVQAPSFASANNGVVFNIGPAGTIANPSGSPLVPIRPDLLADTNGDGIGDGFMTTDGGLLLTGTSANSSAVITGINTTGLVAGQFISGPNLPNGARISTIDSATQLTMTVAHAATGAGTFGFSFANANSYLRALASSEYSPTMRDNQNTMLNVRLTGATTTSGDTRIGTLTMAPGSTLNISGTLPLNSSASRVHLNAPGVFVQSGGTATINGTANTFLQANGGSSLFLHTQGDLNLNATVFSDNAIVKTGAGTLNIGPGVLNVSRSVFQLDGGTVNLAANNSFANVRSTSTFGSNAHLFLNGGTLELNGNSQMINQLNSSNELPGMGGTVTNSGAAATLTSIGGGRFSGTIAGSISLSKPGNNTLLLTNNNTYTGSTKLAAGTLVLRDSGQLSNTSAVDVNYATLQFDNGHLSNVVNRIAPTAPVTLRGATMNMTGAAGLVSSQTINTLNVPEGASNISFNVGGSGAAELNIGNLVRAQGPNGAGSAVNFQQSYGFLGAAGNTTAARAFITNVNGAPLAMNDNIIGGWAVVGGDHFATYLGATGVGRYSNTEDGYALYESTNATTATANQNVNDGTARTFAADTTINAWRIAPNAAVTMTLNTGVDLTLDTGGLITNNNNTTTFTGPADSSITSNSGEFDVWVNQNTTSINLPIKGSIDLVKSGTGTLSLGGANTYTGTTFVNGGTLTLSLTGANGGATVAVPGKLQVVAATVTETVANQLSTNSDIVLGGGGRFNFMSAAGITETVRSITFLDGASGTATANVDRTASNPTSIVNLSGATAISSMNNNPSTGIPFVGANTGILGFTNPTGSTLNVVSPVGSNGLAAVGLRIDALIGAVPTVAEGGLIKSGSGMLVLQPTQGSLINFSGVTTGYNGNVSSLVDVFNIQQGVVRVDVAGALGTNTANTTVQNGAVLLGSNAANIVFTGSVKLKDGATLAATQNAYTLGVATTTAANQSVLNIPSGGTANIGVYDYFHPGTTALNIFVNGRLTGAGNINLTGPALTQGTGGGGVLVLGNPILTGTGANDYTGNITVGPNAVLQNQIAIAGGATRSTGNAIGAATVNLNGGRLRFRDDATSGGSAVSNATLDYSTINVTLTADSFIDAGRVNGTDTNSLNTINLGTLTVPSGMKTLVVDSNSGTGAGAGLGNYRITFNQLNGPGILQKAVGSTLNIVALGTGANTPGFAIAGPAGRVIGPTTGGVNFTPATLSFSSFAVNGLYQTPASKTINAPTFTIGTNPDNVSGRVGVTNTTTINAGVFQNDGVVGPIGGAATLTATTGFRGTGIYQTTGAASGALSSNPLTLSGVVDQGTLRTSGLNTVNLLGANNTHTGGTEVQNGTLRLAPGAATTSPLGTGTVRVFGTPAVAATTTTAPIAAVNATLQFDGGANAISHTGNITNNGTVRVSTGTTTVSGTIAGTTPQFVPGLSEGLVMGTTGLVTDTTRPANPGNFGIQMEPRMLQNNSVTGQAMTGHLDNEVWVYTGYLKDDDGIFSLAQNIDDNAAVWVDGALVLSASNGGTSRVVSTAFKDGQEGTRAPVANANGGTPDQDFGAGITLPGFGDGWHLVEIRMRNGTGGGGPIAGNGFAANYGFGYKNGIAALDGTDMIKPIDNGTGNLFVTPVGGKGTVQVDSSSTLNAGRVLETAAINLNGGATAGTSAKVNLLNAQASAADKLASTGVAGGEVDIAGGGSLTVSELSVSASGKMVINPNNNGTLTITTTHTLGASSVVNIEGGLVEFNGTGGDASAVVNLNAGTASVDGSLTAAVNVNDGILNGDGTIVGPVTLTGGELQPGNSAGSLATGSVDLGAPATLRIEIGGNTAGTQYDQVIVTGGITLAGDLQGSLINGFIPAVNDTFFIMLNNGTDAVSGTFAGLDEGDTVLVGVIPFTVSYVGNGDAGSVGNDVALIAQIPEPGSLVSLLGGMATLIGLQRFRRRRE